MAAAQVLASCTTEASMLFGRTTCCRRWHCCRRASERLRWRRPSKRRALELPLRQLVSRNRRSPLSGPMLSSRTVPGRLRGLRYAESTSGLADRMMPPPAAAPSVPEQRNGRRSPTTRPTERRSRTLRRRTARGDETRRNTAEPRPACVRSSPKRPSGSRSCCGRRWLGEVAFHVPDSVTSWRVMAHALTKDLKYGSARRPFAPSKSSWRARICRVSSAKGTRSFLRVALNNAGEKRLEGKVRLGPPRCGHAESPLRRSSTTTTRRGSFSLKPGASTEVRFSLKAPSAWGPLPCEWSRKRPTCPTESCGRCRFCRAGSTCRVPLATLRDGQKRVLKF